MKSLPGDASSQILSLNSGGNFGKTVNLVQGVEVTIAPSSTFVAALPLVLPMLLAVLAPKTKHILMKWRGQSREEGTVASARKRLMWRRLSMMGSARRK